MNYRFQGITSGIQFFKGYTAVTNEQLEGQGTLPDVVIEPTLQERMEKKDRQLEKAVNWLVVSIQDKAAAPVAPSPTLPLETSLVQLPDQFLKRMLKANQEKQVDENTFEHDYFHIAEDLRWNLIQEKIASANDVKVGVEEVNEVAKQMVVQQFSQYGVPAPENDKLMELANNYLQAENNGERVERIIRDNKVFDVLKKEVKLDMIEMPYTEFVEKMNEKTQHEVEHHH